MYYYEFREALLQMMKDRADREIQMELVDRQKLNGQMRYALMMKSESSACAPVIYLEELYEEFCQGMPMEKIAEKLWLIYSEEMKDDIGYLYQHILRMQSFADAADGLYVRIMHYEKNRKLLQDVPCQRMLDLALTVYYQVKQADGQVRGTVMLRDEHLQDWNVPAEEVFDRAVRNTMGVEEMYWNTLEAVLNREKLLRFPEKPGYSRTGLYVLSTRSGVWGAVAAFLPGAAAGIFKALGEEFYLLPSSIHEVIIAPVSQALCEDLLMQTVRDVNRQEILQEEILSDHIYRYHAEVKRLEIVDDMD